MWKFLANIRLDLQTHNFNKIKYNNYVNSPSEKTCSQLIYVTLQRNF
jgi:hypothetical protein